MPHLPGASGTTRVIWLGSSGGQGQPAGAVHVPPRRPLLALLAALLAVASLATLADAIYEDQVGLAD
ncbi:hypothetical protein ACP4OV_016414 [Aristida adscensionis]